MEKLKPLRDRIKRTGKKPNWENPPPVKPPPNPCHKCGYCIKRLEHSHEILMDICWHPERLRGTGREWTVTNHKGENCEHFDKDKQLRFGVDI